MSTPLPAQAVAPKRQRGRDRVEAILEAATALFDEKAYDSVTMTEVAARSATAIGSLYRFFPTKETLAAALLERYGEKLVGSLSELCERAEPLSPAEAAQGLVGIVQGLRRDRSVALRLLDAGQPAERQALRPVLIALFDRLLTRLGAPARARAVQAVMLLHLFKTAFALPQQDAELATALDGEVEEVIRLYMERVSSSL